MVTSGIVSADGWLPQSLIPANTWAISASDSRLSRLSAASLRINESLDLETVLQGVLDSARSLTNARYGVITTLDESGEVMQRILEIADVPVIFLSAYGRHEVIAQAFDMGAADYVTKPFSPTELVARVKAALRRGASPRRAVPQEPYVSGDLTVNYAERRVTVADRPVHLTATEYRILFELSANAGAVLTHEELLARVWGPQNLGDVRLVRGVVKRLRGKLGDDAGNPRYIYTEIGMGYRMAKGGA